MVDTFSSVVEKDKNIAIEWDELIATIEDVANGKRVPKTQYRKLHLSSKLLYSAYEVKSKHLRIYLIHERETGQIHILGGKKVDQAEDLKKLERIIKEYTHFRQSQKS